MGACRALPRSRAWSCKVRPRRSCRRKSSRTAGTRCGQARVGFAEECRIINVGLQGGCKNNDSSKKLLVFCFWSLWATQGPGLGPNVPPGTSFRTPKHRPSPANGDPTGGETTFWKNHCFCNLPVSGGDRFFYILGNFGGPPGAATLPECDPEGQLLLSAGVSSRSAQWRPDSWGNTVSPAPLRANPPLSLPRIFGEQNLIGGRQRGGAGGRFDHFLFCLSFSKRMSCFFLPPRAPGWPETDSPRKMVANSGVDTQIRALGTRVVAIFRF